ncbi:MULTISPECIES: YchJ family protein [unclassified Pseudoclavibacter]|uniref:YchJ family protein n=1 Tax=unclassified Pseudoclavibacter TaxID=2615177 RepID=UPI001CE46CCE|nr:MULTISPECIES: YchJ family metal-binding protein [unclassified Pseudoclavibacter]
MTNDHSASTDPSAASAPSSSTSAPEAWPETAEALMRSRFEAFRHEDAAWLLASWHPRTRPAELRFDPEVRWRGLQIVDTVAGGSDDSEGIVEFRATYMTGGERGVQQERSRFVRDDGRWVYLDGEVRD